jgi:outer membrane biosynthesis protein TonB
MPQRNSMTDRAFRAARWRRARWDEWNEWVRTPPATTPARRSRRFAASTALVLCYMLGAALSAGAGDTVATLAEGTTTTAPAGDAVTPAEARPTEATAEVAPEQTTTETVPETAAPPSAPQAAEPVAGPEVTPEPTAAPPTAVPEPPPAPAPVVALPEPEPEPGPPAPPAEERPSADPDMPHRVPATAKARPKPQHRAKRTAKASAKRHPQVGPVLRMRARPAGIGSELEPEAKIPGVDATVWLHRSMPDPTPPSKRLSRAFAHRLRSIARASDVDWALMLALIRAEGLNGATPATTPTLGALAARLGELRGQDQRSVALALARDSETADRAVALAHYHRAVGLRALVRGLEWAKPRLEARLLRDDRVATYEGGRFDIESGRVDVRVLVLIAYLADMYGEVTVSSLKTGHRLYSRPGVISAHVYGLAVDIAALGGVPIAGNQEPGGLTEDAVRNIMLLPSELRPRQIISLLGLGGPSFPLGDHGDHIHVGY